MSYLPGYEPNEADMVQMALDMPFERKVEKALAFFREYCDGAYGAFSGGKDSCVIKQLAVEAGVTVHWHYNNTTIDAPELVQFIRKFHPDVKWNNPKVGLINRMVEKANCPTRKGRWCCAEYKEQGGYECDRKILGVRISESENRAKLWKLIVPHRESGHSLLCPIVYWTEKDIWDYIRLRRIPYCKLYDEGFKRLGCIGCPLAGACNVAIEFKRWPRFKKAWQRGFEKLWTRWHGVQTQRTRISSFIKINGNWYPDRLLMKKDIMKFSDVDFAKISTTELEKPVNIFGKWYGNTRQRYFEKHLSGQGFFNWWISGGAFEGDDKQCVFEEMMGQK